MAATKEKGFPLGLISFLLSLLTLFIPFPFKSFSTGGEWYQPMEGPNLGRTVQAPYYHWFDGPWSVDTVAIRCLMIGLAWTIIHVILLFIFKKISFVKV